MYIYFLKLNTTWSYELMDTEINKNIVYHCLPIQLEKAFEFEATRLAPFYIEPILEEIEKIEKANLSDIKLFDIINTQLGNTRPLLSIFSKININQKDIERSKKLIQDLPIQRVMMYQVYLQILRQFSIYSNQQVLLGQAKQYHQIDDNDNGKHCAQSSFNVTMKKSIFKKSSKSNLAWQKTECQGLPENLSCSLSDKTSNRRSSIVDKNKLNGVNKKKVLWEKDVMFKERKESSTKKLLANLKYDFARFPRKNQTGKKKGDNKPKDEPKQADKVKSTPTLGPKNKTQTSNSTEGQSMSSMPLECDPKIKNKEVNLKRDKSEIMMFTNMNQSYLSNPKGLNIINNLTHSFY